jgi:hypothetical protein
MGYKHILRSSEQKFTIFILYCIYIFRASLSRIFLYFFSLKKYLFKYRRVSTSTERDLLQVPATNSLNLPSTKYKLPTTLIKENGENWYDQLINRLFNFYFQTNWVFETSSLTVIKLKMELKVWVTDRQ